MRKHPFYVGGLVVFLVLSLFTPIEEAHFFWEKLPVFNALFGFLGCIVLMFGPKILGKLFIRKGEDYYE
jgi:hypothetical protein